MDPKLSQNDFKMTPKWFQNDQKMFPEWSLVLGAIILSHIYWQQISIPNVFPMWCTWHLLETHCAMALCSELCCAYSFGATGFLDKNIVPHQRLMICSIFRRWAHLFCWDPGAPHRCEYKYPIQYTHAMMPVWCASHAPRICRKDNSRMCTDCGYCPLRKACGAGAAPHREASAAKVPAPLACRQQVWAGFSHMFVETCQWVTHLTIFVIAGNQKLGKHANWFGLFKRSNLQRIETQDTSLAHRVHTPHHQYHMEPLRQLEIIHTNAHKSSQKNAQDRDSKTTELRNTFSDATHLCNFDVFIYLVLLDVNSYLIPAYCGDAYGPSGMMQNMGDYQPPAHLQAPTCRCPPTRIGFVKSVFPMNAFFRSIVSFEPSSFTHKIRPDSILLMIPMCVWCVFYFFEHVSMVFRRSSHALIIISRNEISFLRAKQNCQTTAKTPRRAFWIHTFVDFEDLNWSEIHKLSMSQLMLKISMNQAWASWEVISCWKTSSEYILEPLDPANKTLIKRYNLW